MRFWGGGPKFFCRGWRLVPDCSKRIYGGVAGFLEIGAAPPALFSGMRRWVRLWAGIEKKSPGGGIFFVRAGRALHGAGGNPSAERLLFVRKTKSSGTKVS